MAPAEQQQSSTTVTAGVRAAMRAMSAFSSQSKSSRYSAPRFLSFGSSASREKRRPSLVGDDGLRAVAGVVDEDAVVGPHVLAAQPRQRRAQVVERGQLLRHVGLVRRVGARRGQATDVLARHADAVDEQALHGVDVVDAAGQHPAAIVGVDADQEDVVPAAASATSGFGYTCAANA